MHPGSPRAGAGSRSLRAEDDPRRPPGDAGGLGRPRALCVVLPSGKRRTTLMGMTSYVMGIGPFSAPISRYLEYRVEFYSETPEGTTVFAELFICQTHARSLQLAGALGATPGLFQT